MVLWGLNSIIVAYMDPLGNYISRMAFFYRLLMGTWGRAYVTKFFKREIKHDRSGGWEVIRRWTSISDWGLPSSIDTLAYLIDPPTKKYTFPPDIVQHLDLHGHLLALCTASGRRTVGR